MRGDKRFARISEELNKNLGLVRSVDRLDAAKVYEFVSLHEVCCLIRGKVTVRNRVLVLAGLWFILALLVHLVWAILKGGV